MGTAERRLKLIRILSQRRYDTIPNLAFEFRVSERTILRDIDEISDMIPIYCRQGRYEGGIYVDEDYRMDRAYMDNDELSLLKKIRANVTNEEKITLSNDELMLLDRIIKDYSIPLANIFRKPDSICQV